MYVYIYIPIQLWGCSDAGLCMEISAMDGVYIVCTWVTTRSSILIIRLAIRINQIASICKLD